MINLEELCLISLVLMLLAWFIYCLCSEQGRFLHHLVIVGDKVKSLINSIWFEVYFHLSGNSPAMLRCFPEIVVFSLFCIYSCVFKTYLMFRILFENMHGSFICSDRCYLIMQKLHDISGFMYAF